MNLPQVTVKDEEDIREDVVVNTLRRAISYHSTLQAHDGHWPGDYGGPMFLMPGLVSFGIFLHHFLWFYLGLEFDKLLIIFFMVFKRINF